MYIKRGIPPSPVSSARSTRGPSPTPSSATSSGDLNPTRLFKVTVSTRALFALSSTLLFFSFNSNPSGRGLYYYYCWASKSDVLNIGSTDGCLIFCLSLPRESCLPCFLQHDTIFWKGNPYYYAYDNAHLQKKMTNSQRQARQSIG